jgi:hypothetical protein
MDTTFLKSLAMREAIRDTLLGGSVVFTSASPVPGGDHPGRRPDTPVNLAEFGAGRGPTQRAAVAKGGTAAAAKSADLQPQRVDASQPSRRPMQTCEAPDGEFLPREPSQHLGWTRSMQRATQCDPRLDDQRQGHRRHGTGRVNWMRIG